MVPCFIDTYSLNRYSLVRAARAGTQAASDGGGAAASSGGGHGRESTPEKPEDLPDRVEPTALVTVGI